MSQGSFKDLFSARSDDYARFRPTYPEALFDWLRTLAPASASVWDCGTGSGQAALPLATRFARVIATDPSEKQLASAERHSKVEYRVAAAERSGLDDASVDLITVAQAFHWFRHSEFFAEARRMLRPGGALVIWSYALARVSPEVDAAVLDLYERQLGRFWEPERRLVEDGYRGIPWPLEAIDPPGFVMEARWNFEQLFGYLGTWSALKSCINRTGLNPLENSRKTLESAWGNASERIVRWDLSVRAGRFPFATN